MSNDNPFGAMGGQYTTSVSYGAAADAPQAAAAGLIKDTTTAGFSADVIQESRRQPVLVDFWRRGAVPASSWGRFSKRPFRRPAGASSSSR